MPKELLPQNIHSMDSKALLKLWSQYVSRGQTTLIGAFGFGHDRPVSAQGAYITLNDGRRILDFTGGVGVLNHGHNHPRIVNARVEYQLKNRLEVHKNYFSPYTASLAKRWASLMPGDLEVCYFPNSGAEAVEGAVKLAYKYHRGSRGTILRSHIAFHGKLLGAGGLTASPEVNFSFPTIPGIDEFIFDDIESVKRALERHQNSDESSDVYAVIIEPFSASTLRGCSESFLRSLTDICRALDIIVIFDEVYTGWAKTGSLFHFMRYEGVLPDIVTTSKSFGGGKSSISGFITRSPVFEKAYGRAADATLHSTTYFGFGEEAATALVAIDVTTEENFCQRSLALGEAIERGLDGLCRKFPRFFLEHRGEGALRGVRISPAGSRLLNSVNGLPGPWHGDKQFAQKLSVAAVVSRLYDTHKILTYFASNEPIMLIIAPSLICSEEEVDYFIKALEECAEYGLLRLILDFSASAVKR